MPNGDIPARGPIFTRRPSPGLFISLGIIFFCVYVVACGLPGPSPTSPSPTVSLQPSPSATASQTLSLNQPATQAPLLIEPTYPGPTLLPATAIPPPLDKLDIPDDVKSGILVGLDQNTGRTGRSNALVLFFINPRTSKASLVTIPQDLFVYIPGYTMQRINVAYPIGGIELLQNTLKYNLGVQPNLWVVAHPDDFENVVNDLNGINVFVVDPIPDICGGFPAGEVFMDGPHALCYVTLLKPQEKDTFQRSIRQEEVIRALFLRMVNGGNLIRLPDLYRRYQTTLRTNLDLGQLTASIPFAINLGDSGRIGYFQINEDLVTSWVLPSTDVSVYLPRRDRLTALLQQAVDYVSVPAQQTDRVTTLAYELTISPTPSETPTITSTPTFTLTPTRTLTPVPSITRTPTITSTRTITTTPSPTLTRTLANTPTQTLTPSQTNTSTSTLTSTVTQTLTTTP